MYLQNLQVTAMVKLEIRQIIEQEAHEAEIDADLVEAFVIVESSGNPEATRYEPAFYKTYILPMLYANNNLSPEEARKLATSWGLMQIMGQVARERGFKGEMEELLEPATGLEWSLKHLKRFILKHPDMDSAIASYNAGSPRRREDGNFVNQDYVNKVKRFWKLIRGEA